MTDSNTARTPLVNSRQNRNSSQETLFEEFMTPRPSRQPRASLMSLNELFGPKDERSIIIGIPNLGFTSNFVSTTKYTLLTFLPRNLFEQFLRVANFYFLVMAIMQCIPQISPYEPWTSIMPLLFVLAVTAVKEAFEDLQRYKQDQESNNHPLEVARQSATTGKLEWMTVRWRDVRVGEFLRIKNNDPVPCDTLVVATSADQGLCYIESANLDGETNLKIYQAPAPLMDAFHKDEFNIHGSISCEVPNNRIYKFFGNFNLGADESWPLDYKQLLLRGHTVRNTEWVVGVAVYTGNETKLMKNSTRKSIKQSKLEGKANRNIMFMMVIQLTLSVFLTILYYLSSSDVTFWYVGESGTDSEVSEYTFFVFFTWLILLSTLIPISLYVSIELVKVAQAMFIGWDKAMYSEEYDVNACARTSNLNEELGQVQYIFSDKTGTLTRNQMDFVKCTIGGNVYGSHDDEKSSPQVGPKAVRSNSAEEMTSSRFNDSIFDRVMFEDTKDGEQAREFLLLCALCHTVVRLKDPTTQKYSYEGASPDEIALVKFAASKGYRFIDRDQLTVTIEVPVNQTECRCVKYELLNLIEFDSTRKRMSVILRNPENQVVMYCKGADTAILERICDNDPMRSSVINSLAEFATSGLRTLCLSRAVLEEEEYGKWNELWRGAEVSVHNREEKLAKAAEIIENELNLVGASAIEDKLQEGVPDTIHTLLRANINIWMLTGDKEETAVNIGHSCRLISNDRPLIRLTATHVHDKNSVEMTLSRAIAEAPAGNPTLQIIIDGRTLEWLLEDFSLLLLQAAPLAKSVIVCRASPLQKAEIVGLVKEGMQKITLAIGDGANDVPMIQAAHLGIGIEGEEGCQAVRASDYSIGQFRFLQQLLLVQGRLCFRRIAALFLYSFYKNYSFALCHLWLGFISAFSGQTFYNDMVVSCYNMFFTSLPVLVLGTFDADLKPETMLKHPELYISGQQNKVFKLRHFWMWIFIGVYQSIPVFIIPLSVFDHIPLSNGQSGGFWVASCVSTTAVALIANVEILLCARSINGIMVVTVVLCFSSFYFVTLAYEFYLSVSYPNDPLGGVLAAAVREPSYWLTVVIIVALAVLPHFIVRAVLDLHFPSRETILREQERFEANTPFQPSRVPTQPIVP